MGFGNLTSRRVLKFSEKGGEGKEAKWARKRKTKVYRFKNQDQKSECVGWDCIAFCNISTPLFSFVCHGFLTSVMINSINGAT